MSESQLGQTLASGRDLALKMFAFRYIWPIGEFPNKP
jgi:hypothetical protein